MKTKELLQKIAEFQKQLEEHQKLWSNSLDITISEYPIKNQDVLRQQSRELCRSLGQLRPFLERFKTSWAMYLPDTDVTWDGLDVSVGLDNVAAIKGDSIESVIPSIDQIIGKLQNMDQDKEILFEKQSVKGADEEVFELRPNIYGIGFNLKALRKKWRKHRK